MEILWGEWRNIRKLSFEYLNQENVYILSVSGSLGETHETFPLLWLHHGDQGAGLHLNYPQQGWEGQERHHQHLFKVWIFVKYITPVKSLYPDYCSGQIAIMGGRAPLGLAQSLPRWGWEVQRRPRQCQAGSLILTRRRSWARRKSEPKKCHVSMIGYNCYLGNIVGKFYSK